jgi:hypothetical protein
MCPLYIRCSTLILFTRIAMLNRPVVRRGGHVKCESLGANNKPLGRTGQTRKIQHGRELTMGSVKLEDEARMDILARCFKK